MPQGEPEEPTDEGPEPQLAAPGQVRQGEPEEPDLQAEAEVAQVDPREAAEGEEADPEQQLEVIEAGAQRTRSGRQSRQPDRYDPAKGV